MFIGQKFALDLLNKEILVQFSHFNKALSSLQNQLDQ